MGVPLFWSCWVSEEGRLPTHMPIPKTASARSKHELMCTVWQPFSPIDTLLFHEATISWVLRCESGGTYVQTIT